MALCVAYVVASGASSVDNWGGGEYSYIVFCINFFLIVLMVFAHKYMKICPLQLSTMATQLIVVINDKKDVAMRFHTPIYGQFFPITFRLHLLIHSNTVVRYCIILSFLIVWLILKTVLCVPYFLADLEIKLCN